MKNIFNFSVRYFLFICCFFLFISLFFFLACDDPNSQLFKTNHVDERYDVLLNNDTTTVLLQTIREDSIRTDEFTREVIGFYQDDVFGKTRSSVFTQIRLPKNDIEFVTNTIVDSAVLYLRYSAENPYFGWLSSKMHIKVFELGQEIYLDSSYFSSSIIKTGSEVIGEWYEVPKPEKESVLSIKLSNNFAQKFLSMTKEQRENDKDFVKFMKGLALIPQQVNGQGSLVFFHLLSDLSNLTLYYRNNADSKTAVFQITDKCPRICLFNHDFTSTPIGEQLTSQENLFKSVYLKPLAGVKVKIDIPYLKNFVGKDMYAVNFAQLIVKVDDIVPYLTSKPAFLLLLKTNKNNENFSLVDRFETYYGGKYDSEKMEYRFVLTRYFQDLLKQYYQNKDFEDEYDLHLIIPSDNPITATPILLKNVDEQGTPQTKLIFSLTRL